MELTDINFTGPPIDDAAILESIPAEYRSLLEQVNGFIQFGGGLHLRGACREPLWHSLREVWSGEHVMHRLYSAVYETDVPFGQDAVGDQFLLRDGIVWHLYAETGELETKDCGLLEFLERAQADPLHYLSLQPLYEFQRRERAKSEGSDGMLLPGYLLSVYPPFCTAESRNGVSLRPTPALERLAFLADFAAQVSGIP